MKKLNLTKETLVQLGAEQAQDVAGGVLKISGATCVCSDGPECYTAKCPTVSCATCNCPTRYITGCY